MLRPVFLPALAALMVQTSALSAALAPAPAPNSPLASDNATLAGAMDGRRLDLALRGVGRSVHAKALPTESGCSTRIIASTLDGSDAGTRLLRWADVAWTGELPDGRVMVAFYEQEGRLPGDRLAFAPADPAAFEAALKRVVETCRGAAGEGEQVLSGDYSGSRSCYFTRSPGLELVESTPPQREPTRAVVTVLAQDTPDAELRLLTERGAEGDGWEEPEVAFTLAGAGMEDLRISAVRFALDGEPVDPQHSIAIYNNSRLRIRMNPIAATAPNEDSYYRRLFTSTRATVTLIDSEGAIRAVLNFETGPALAAARLALDNAAWSCATASAAPALAARWQTAP